MKLLLIVPALFAAAALQAQTTPLESSMAAHVNHELTVSPPVQQLAPLTLKANEIKAGQVTYSGVFVELAKVDHRWQMINPFAPASYGSSADNTAINPMTGRGSGLKLFSIEF